MPNIASIRGFKPRVDRNETLNIGDFQASVLGAVRSLGADSHAKKIMKLLSTSLGREVSQPQIFAALKKLEALGLLTSEVEGKNSVGRRGRPRRIYSITAPGLRMLDARGTFSKSVRGMGVNYATSLRRATTA